MAMKMERLPDWEARWLAYLDRVATTPFAFGHHDCCLFAAGAVEALTGIDLAGDWRGRYKTEAGAARMIRRRGLTSPEDVVTAALGEPVGPLVAGRGDVVSDGQNVGVMDHRGAWFVTDDGLALLPQSGAVRCWKVGWRG